MLKIKTKADEKKAEKIDKIYNKLDELSKNDLIDIIINNLSQKNLKKFL